MRILMKVFDSKDENLIINVILCQNLLGKILKVFEEYIKAKEFKLPFKRKELLNVLYCICEVLEWQFERNEHFPYFSSQLETSYNWKKIKQLKKGIKIENA